MDSEDDEAAEQASLESLLGSRERDYVISNKGDMVPIHTLKDKVVALYIYKDFSNKGDRVAPLNFVKDGPTNDELIIKLMMAYKELAENKENFEVVLLYLNDTPDTLDCTHEESFWKIFKTMPWLALPFKDANQKKLRRIFGFAKIDVEGLRQPPKLVIFGTNGELVDQHHGAVILRNCGTSGYPFTLQDRLKLETEKLDELKLEILWDPNTARVKKDGLEISFSQFAGKRLFIYLDREMSHCTNYYMAREDDLRIMESLYWKMKDTDDEFEVIYIKASPSYYEPDCPQLYYGEGYYSPSVKFASSLKNSADSTLTQ